MTLMLEVVGPEAEKLGAASRKMFHAAGGTIGRLPDNAWVLPDPYVSSRHAVIRYADGVFYIEDTSTNGVYINSPENCLVRGQPYPLQSGDWIFIEPYEIRAVVAAESQEAAPSALDDMFASAPASRDRVPIEARMSPSGRPAPRHQPPSSAVPPMDIVGDAGIDSELDPLKLIGIDEPARSAVARIPTALDLEANPVWAEPIEAPRAARPAPPEEAVSSAPIPEDWFDDSSAGAPLSPAVPSEHREPAAGPPRVAARPRPGVPSSPSAVERAKPPSSAAGVPPAPASRDTSELAAVLAAAGVAGVAVSPELTQNLGRMLRVVIAGVMDMLRARQQTKSALGLDQTIFRPADNNPLKFSANVEDALHNLFVKRNAAFLGPVDAFEDAFDDVRNHQMAMLHGIRIGFTAMLAQFDPDRLQQDFDRQLKKGALVAVPAKLRYWEMYRETFHDMVKDPETAFRELFGDEFASAYEEQLNRLKEPGRGRKS